MPIDSAARLAETPNLQVRTPHDLLHAVPYLLGFHPDDSFVVVGIDRSQVVLAARCDLDDARAPQLLSQLVRALVDAEAREVIAVVYSDGGVATDPLVLPHGDAVADFGEAAEVAGLAFIDALLLSHERWWSYCCSDDACCPREGEPFDRSRPSTVAVAATVAGLVAMPDRATFAAQLEPVPMSQRQGLQPLLAHYENVAFEAVMDERTARWRRSMVRAVFARARLADTDNPLMSDARIAEFGVALNDADIRDSVWVAMDEHRIDGRELWRLLARRLPAPYDATPLFLVGWGAWREGNGALASIAATRAVESDPHYTPADLLLAAVDSGVNPRRMPRIRPARLRMQRSA